MPRGKRKTIIGAGGFVKLNPAVENPIVKDVSKLMRSMRVADSETLEAARAALQEFADSWLVSGDGKNLEGAGECCLADSDLATAVIPVLEVWMDNNQ